MVWLDRLVQRLTKRRCLIARSTVSSCLLSWQIKSMFNVLSWDGDPPSHSSLVICILLVQKWAVSGGALEDYCGPPENVPLPKHLGEVWSRPDNNQPTRDGRGGNRECKREGEEEGGRTVMKGKRHTCSCLVWFPYHIDEIWELDSWEMLSYTVCM